MITAPASWPVWAQVLGGLGVVFVTCAAIVAAMFGLLWLFVTWDAPRWAKRVAQDRAASRHPFIRRAHDVVRRGRSKRAASAPDARIGGPMSDEFERLKAAGMYCEDGGPTYFERHGHTPDEMCTPRCPGSPSKPGGNGGAIGRCQIRLDGICIGAASVLDHELGAACGPCHRYITARNSRGELNRG